MDFRKKFVPAKIVKTNRDQFQLEMVDKPVRVRKELNGGIKMEGDVPPVRYYLGQKSFVTKCYFQPKQVPVRYSETMILKLGSTRKRYFESVYYENKLMPCHWRETMVAEVNTEPCKSNAIIRREETFHYMPLNQRQHQVIHKPQKESPMKSTMEAFLNNERTIL